MKLRLFLKQGQSLFEVVLALGLISLILLALVTLGTLSVRNVARSRNNAQATKHSQEAIEWLRGERDRDWDEFVNRALVSTWCLKSLSWTDAEVGGCGDGDEIENTVFSREVAFLASSEGGGGVDSVQTQVIVFWTDAQGYHEVRASTFLTHWRREAE